MSTQDYGLVLGAFVADSLALGAHWIYDVAQIDQQFGRIDSLRAPRPDSYHKSKKVGEFTHYGDQCMWLLKHLGSQKGSFDLPVFAQEWRLHMSSYQGYLDRASKEVLNKLAEGNTPGESGSKSTDLGGVARIAPLFFCYRNSLADMETVGVAQTTFTHAGPGIREAVLFLARSTFAILNGATVQDGFAQAMRDGVNDIDLDLRLRQAMELPPGRVRDTVKQFGQACGLHSALPGAVYTILSYPDNFREALVATVMAGGDSAARGMVVGMILGASLGESQIPAAWLEEMKAADKIMTILRTLP